MAFLNNISELRAIDWGKSFLWDFRIPDAPSPFNAFFPAIDIQENLASLDSFDVEIYNTTVKIPKSRSVKTVELTYSDDENNTGLSFFTDWVSNTIFSETSNRPHTATLQEASKRIQIQKLNSNRESLLLSSYLVYPEGPLTFKGDSESGTRINQINLIVVATESQGERGD